VYCRKVTSCEVGLKRGVHGRRRKSWALDLGERRTPDFRALHSENSEDSTVEDYPCRQAPLSLLPQELGDAGSAQTFSTSFYLTC
jgi:hypothetical protein